MSFEVNGLGRFVKDPELRNAGQTVVCDFTLASNEVIKGGADKKEIASFFSCVVWDKAAEVVAKYCKKGDKIFVRGTLRQDKWEKDGQKREKVVLRVTDFEFVGGNRNVGESKESKGSGESVDATVDGGGNVPF